MADDNKKELGAIKAEIQKQQALEEKGFGSMYKVLGSIYKEQVMARKDGKKGDEAKFEANKDAKKATKEQAKQSTLLGAMVKGLKDLNKSILDSMKSGIFKGLGILVAGIAAPVIAMVAFFKQLALEFAFLKKLTGGTLKKIFSPLKNFFKVIQNWGKGNSTVVKAGEKLAKITKSTLKFIDTMHFGIFSKIGNFFRTFGKGTAFTKITSVLKGLGSLVSKGINILKSIFVPIGKFFRAVFKMGKFVVDFGGTATKIAKWAAGFGKILGKIFLPITILMSVFDFVTGFMDGYKEDGIMGGLEGGLSKLLKGLIGMPLDLLKDGVSWIMEKFGWTQASETLDSFSFSDLIDKMVGGFFTTVEGIIGWVKESFKFGTIGEALTSMLNVIWLPAKLFKDWLINPIVEWLGDKLGFDTTGFTEFDPLKMVGNLVDDMVEWFGKIFDLDIGGIIKSMAGKLGKPGLWLLGKVGLGPDIDEENKKETLKKEIAEIQADVDDDGMFETKGNQKKNREELAAKQAELEEMEKGGKASKSSGGKGRITKWKKKQHKNRIRIDKHRVSQGLDPKYTDEQKGISMPAAVEMPDDGTNEGVHKKVAVSDANMDGVKWTSINKGGREGVEEIITDIWNKHDIKGKPTFTSGFREPKSALSLANTKSKHPHGTAFDLRSRDIPQEKQGAVFADLQQSLGIWGQHEVGKVNAKKRTGEHFHFQAAAEGFQGIVDKATIFLVGEDGAEAVSVSPLSSPQDRTDALSAMQKQNLDSSGAGGAPIVIAPTTQTTQVNNAGAKTIMSNNSAQNASKLGNY